MKPLHIVMENFGPFIKETIDFEQVETDQLFLISGKTGSGKTMIFDAIVYALYGMASTKTRKEGDLRSHFADGKSPMSVIYQFKVNNQTFKIHREAPFIKEGNITKTQAKLNIYELVDNQFELRESKVNQGNQFIVQLLGVNAEQFRQLFILPQGEFKKFLQSNSKDKQSILRTLFNSERFDEIRHLLVENVKQEKVQIENRYTQIENLWNDIDTFNNDELLDETNSQIATISYKIDNNSNKFNKIKNIIQILDDELKVQKEIFLLSEILAGKNDYKLTLENYVLIYYLEKIIFQANQRLSFMSGNRYQLIRREAISLGLSGLEIDVFDFHSNKSRHISSLSGGETFQASLALALGLSEVVQQESGGITLDSMFIDEGFGTLDQETLETAIDTLINLKSSGRMVGIISHVSELKQRIPLILEVTSNQYESHTQFRKN
ncbi:AAA family ATPase [Staphylococcus epidermidis]|nr:AAA family ATPase [Staphylococcus epidermidis]